MRSRWLPTPLYVPCCWPFRSPLEAARPQPMRRSCCSPHRSVAWTACPLGGWDEPSVRPSVPSWQAQRYRDHPLSSRASHCAITTCWTTARPVRRSTRLARWPNCCGAASAPSIPEAQQRRHSGCSGRRQRGRRGFGSRQAQPARPAVGPTAIWMPSVPCSRSPLAPRSCQVCAE